MAPRPLLAVFAALVAFGVLAGSASAAKFERQGTTLLYTGAAGDVVDVTTRGRPERQPQADQRDRGDRQHADGPCRQPVLRCRRHADVQPPPRHRSPRRCCGSRPTAGDDEIDSSGIAQPFDSSLPTEFVTGAGRDTITGGAKFDSVFAGPGDDRITGGGGADVLRGEEGADTFLGLVDDVTVLGGPGTDLLDLSGRGDGRRGDHAQRRARRRPARRAGERRRGERAGDGRHRPADRRRRRRTCSRAAAATT